MLRTRPSGRDLRLQTPSFVVTDRLRLLGSMVSKPRGDAWCATCEKVRIAEGDRAGIERALGGFADIKILCGACYDRVRAINVV